MTVKEMGMLFALIRLAWPNAPMFHNGTLDATIRLWTACMPEVDFLTGQMATVQLCRTCKFPPTIAEMLAAATEAQKQIENRVYVASFIADEERRYPPYMIEEEARQKIREELSQEMGKLPAPKKYP